MRTLRIEDGSTLEARRDVYRLLDEVRRAVDQALGDGSPITIHVDRATEKTSGMCYERVLGVTMAVTIGQDSQRITVREDA